MFEFDDSNDINEDTIVVTGFTARFDIEFKSCLFHFLASALTILWSSRSGEKC